MIEIEIDNIVSKFRKPTFDMVSNFYEKLQTKDLELSVYDAQFYLLKACFLEGDERILDLENNVHVFLKYVSEGGAYNLFHFYETTCEVLEDGIKIVVKVDENTSYSAKFLYLRNFNTFMEYMELAKYPFNSDYFLATQQFAEGDRELISYDNPDLFISYKHHLYQLIEIFETDLKKNSNTIVKLV